MKFNTVIKFKYLLSAVIIFSASTICGEELFTGKLYKMGSNKKTLLYIQKNSHVIKGNKKIFKHIYRYPNGKLSALEEVVYKGNTLISYKVEMPLGDCGCILKKKGKRVIFSFTRGNKNKKGSAKYRNNIVTGPTLTDFVGKNWSKIKKGKDVYFYLPAMSLQRMAKFYLRKNSKSRYNRKGVMVVRMKISNYFFRLFVDPVDLVYDTKTKRLVEIHGKSLLKRKVNGKIINPEVDIYYKYGK